MQAETLNKLDYRTDIGKEMAFGHSVSPPMLAYGFLFIVIWSFTKNQCMGKEGKYSTILFP